ncbi:hypothetical protein [Streptomyces atroolivaceus]|uniref:hypothetical protein n=1 Tax=Streptomyces atroolivaceus TaxID=66869 RepID=UPI00367FFFB1
MSFDEAAAAAAEAAHGLLNACAVPAPKLATPALCLPTVRDGLDEFRRVYGERGGEALLVRPDGHLGLRVTPALSPELPAHLDMLFGR